MKHISILFLSAVMLAGCLKSGSSYTATCNYDACAAVAPAAEIAAVKAYLDSTHIIATQHCSGLFYAIDSIGTGTAPTACSYVAVNYKGSLTNGTVFDQGSLQYPLLNLIAGWKNGLPLIKEGGKIRLYIPPSLGYGNQATGSIPANSILIFEISLLGVQ